MSDNVSVRHVAELAGVSAKTVSNVVNGYPHVRPATREKVEQAIATLGYRPNLSARSLRSGRTGIIALAVPDLASPYFAEIATRVVEAAERRGLTVLIDQTAGRRERELSVLQGIRSHLIDGAIFSPLALGREDGATHTPSLPLVLLGERVFEADVDHVAIDNVAAAMTAVRHLLERGRQRLAIIGAQSAATAETARLRVEGYTCALAEAGRRPRNGFVVEVENWHRADGATAARTLLDRRLRPDAIFCCNDLLALGALAELNRQGIRVPDDVAVIGVDDIEEASFSTPTLSTIAPDKDALTTRSLELLIDRITRARVGRAFGAEDVSGPRDVTVPHRLVVREST